MKFLALLLLVALSMVIVPAAAQAKIVAETVPYEHDGVKLEGFIAYDDATEEKRPGVLVIHEWWGLNDYAKMRAKQLAEMGYVAMAVDMYGAGVLAKTQPEAAALAGKVRGNPKLMRERA